MTPTDYRDALRLLNSALAAVEQRPAKCPVKLHRRLRRLSIELALLRVRLRQPAIALRRN